MWLVGSKPKWIDSLRLCGTRFRGTLGGLWATHAVLMAKSKGIAAAGWWSMVPCGCALLNGGRWEAKTKRLATKGLRGCNSLGSLWGLGPARIAKAKRLTTGSCWVRGWSIRLRAKGNTKEAAAEGDGTRLRVCCRRLLQPCGEAR